jgi:hypothetical protein
MSLDKTNTSTGCDTLKNFVVKFENEMINYTSENNSYSKWSSRLSQWEKETGEFYYLAQKRKEYENRANETRLWKNCVDGNWHCSNKDQWCRDDFGSDFPVFINCVQADCGAYRKGVCGRSQNTKNAIMEEFERYKLTQRPTTSGLPNDYKEWNTNNRPQRPSLNFGQIVCCNQVIKDVDVINGNISNEAITQKCQAQQTQTPQSQAPQSQAPQSQAPQSQAPQSQLQPLQEESQTKEEESQQIYIGIIIVVIVLLLLFSSSGIGFLLFTN